jgi:hypothetical protein
VKGHLLKSLDKPLILAMEEVDNVFATGFRTNFFGMLRNWHNSRALDPLWRKLDLILVTSTEPYLFIEDLTHSPFNVGENIELEDFTYDQVAELNHRHNAPLTPDQVQQLMGLLNGHPYLTRRALYLVASGRHSFADLFERATTVNGPFGSHLRALLWRLRPNQELLAQFRQIIKHHSCSDEEIFFRLRGAGLVRREQDADLPRCQLYANFFAT